MELLPRIPPVPAGELLLHRVQQKPGHHVGAIILGQRLLRKLIACRHGHIDLQTLSREQVALLLSRHGFATLEELYEAVGTGEIPASKVLRNLLDLV